MTFTNKILEIASHISNICGEKRFKIPKGYKLVHEDNFDKVDYDYWIMPNAEGTIKTNDLKVYWDGIHAIKTKDNILELGVEYLPKVFYVKDLPQWQRNELNYEVVQEETSPVMYNTFNRSTLEKTNQYDTLFVPYVSGNLRSKYSYRYGIFSIETMLPKGTNLWGAFWLSGLETWPPEIDMFESYNIGDKIEPNVHYGDCYANHKQTGSTNIAMKDKYDKWHEIVGWWEKDFIKIYYDGRLVYKVTDKKILDWFNNKTQTVILNNNIQMTRETGIIQEPMDTPLRFRNFKIWQK